MQRKNIVRAVIIASIIALVVIGLGICANRDDEHIEDIEVQSIYGDESLGIDATVDEELSDYRNILVYGIDKKHRSDIMMVFSINKKTNKVKLFSIYRDTYLKMNEEAPLKFGGVDYPYFKCNHAYFKYDMENSMKTLNRQLDLNVHEAIAMDWNTIARFVDLLGGIDVEVTDAMLPLVNREIRNESKKLPSAGEYTLKNEQAVAYLRTRRDADATVRAHRNEEVFVQLFKKAQAMDTTEKLEILDEIASDADTNMSRGTMVDTLAQISGMEIEPCDSWPYDYDIEWHRTGSYYFFVPLSLESNVIKLHKNIFGQKNYNPSETVKTISKEIETTDELE